MATDRSGSNGKENRNNTMNISVFCGASLPHSATPHLCAVKMQK